MKLQPQEIKKIAIFRALQLGDLLCAIPAIRALRHAYPQAHITLLSMPWAESLVTRFPIYFNSFVHFPGYPGLPEQKFTPKAFTAFLSVIQEEAYDLVLQMQGNGTLVNPMIELLGGRYTAGFCTPNDYCPNKDLFMEYPNGIHEVERHIRLMQHLGISSQGTDLEFPITQKDEQDFAALQLPVIPQQYVCIHPGSRGRWRQWPVEHFAAMADYAANKGLQIVITGTGDELAIVQDVAKQMSANALVVAGKTSLGAVAVLLKRAFALVSNCTGVSHIAAALQTPSVVISMDGEPERWAPLNTELHITINWTKTPQFTLALEALKHLISRYTKGNQLRDQTVSISGEQLPNSL
jgi:ADP-heptose:LPS heptosyltransferase